MKHIIILGDGMADKAIEKLGGKTPLQFAKTPYMDMLAKKGRTGRLMRAITQVLRLPTPLYSAMTSTRFTKVAVLLRPLPSVTR